MRRARRREARTASAAAACCYEPAERGSPLETDVEHASAICSSCRRCSRGCAREFGPDVHLLHDVHHRLTPIEAARLGKTLEPYQLFWLEDPTPAENQESFRLIRQHTTTPLAVGEVFNSIHDCRQLIQEQLIDYIRTTVVHAGGISHLRKIASLAELYHVRTGSHGATDLSPVCMAAALHFDLSVHNFGIQEYMPHTAETDRVFPHAYTFEGGAMHPGDAPGLGVDIDEALAATFPVRARPTAGGAPGRRHDARLVRTSTGNCDPRRAQRSKTTKNSYRLFFFVSFDPSCPPWFNSTDARVVRYW